MTRSINVGGVVIGGGAPVSIQSMCSTDTRDVTTTLAQIHALARAGCQIVRLAVPDKTAAEAFAPLTRQSPLPLVADIHFDHTLAIQAARNGAAKIRLNPGNIRDREKLREVARVCLERGIPIRIGVNAGSVPPGEIHRHGLVEAMTRSALSQADTLLSMGFAELCLSLKASNVSDTIAANRAIAQQTDIPLHLGITEAGTSYHGIIKSAVGLGALLSDGIGDTLRVSLTADPVEEVRAARAILRALGLRREGVEIISCPTCGRCRLDVEGLATAVEERLRHITVPLRVAVMGCAVNGPGEAREADCGIAGGDGEALFFRKGQVLCKLPETEIADRLCAEATALAARIERGETT